MKSSLKTSWYFDAEDIEILEEGGAILAAEDADVKASADPSSSGQEES